MIAMEHIYLLIGSNLGNVQGHIEKACRALEHHNITIVKKSNARMTRPWGRTDQPDFLNMAVEVRYEHSPRELLRELKTIEQELGRTEGERWGPRIIDIDILFFGQQIVNQDDLVIPHPRVLERPFAMELMKEIAPDFVPPGSDMSIKEYNRETVHERKTIHCH